MRSRVVLLFGRVRASKHMGGCPVLALTTTTPWRVSSWLPKPYHHTRAMSC
jgi:hypothetical protein